MKARANRTGRDWTLLAAALLVAAAPGVARPQSQNVGVGLLTPKARFNVYENGANTSKPVFTRAVANAGVLVTTDPVANAYTPGLFWNTSVLHADVPRAGIFLKGTNQGYYMYVATSDATGSGITNDGIVIDPAGKVGIGTETPAANLQVMGSIMCNTTPLCSSDLRYKKDISDLNGSLEMVEKLRGVSFLWRRDEFPAMNFAGGRKFGFIAQEMEKVCPELVFTDDRGYKSIEYANVTPILVEAIKEQQRIIDRQGEEIRRHAQSVSQLQATVSALEARLRKLEDSSVVSALPAHCAELRDLSADRPMSQLFVPPPRHLIVIPKRALGQGQENVLPAAQ